MEMAMRYVKDVGGHVQGSFSYTISPVHTIAGYVEMAHELKDLGADSICIKDMAGMIAPYDTFELVGELKAQVGLPVQFHTHYTSGMAMASALKAVEAGVDIVDTAISSLSGLTAQPPTESLVAILKGTPRDTGLDLNLLAEISEYFSNVRKKYMSFESGLQGVDVRVLQYQIPGGMLSNLTSQLRQQGAGDRYEEVLVEVPRVREDLGFPPLVTPSSQIVGTQATLNVVLGERYKVIPEEVKNYVRGFYGRPPAAVDPAVKQKVIGDEEPITVRPADLLEPGMDKARVEIGELAQDDEDVISYALFPQVAKPYLERRARGADEYTAIIAAIAAKLALQADATAAVQPAETAEAAVSPWKLAWRPAQRWTGLPTP
jgi:oxaloacetate decarboxylase alpha subunit